MLCMLYCLDGMQTLRETCNVGKYELIMDKIAGRLGPQYVLDRSEPLQLRLSAAAVSGRGAVSTIRGWTVVQEDPTLQAPTLLLTPHCQLDPPLICIEPRVRYTHTTASSTHSSA
jgi:hypothetical protein